ncbi:MAG: bi-domain-containing oxidoreductase [Chloroflexi bacterium]|nr:bi-domain-containing oxidoreductase [Chloroflexota bacterium]
MKVVLQNSRTGGLEAADVPPPVARAEGMLVRNAYSLISAGTERTSRELARKSLVGKALARPDQVRRVLEVAQREGIAAARERVAARLDVSRPLGYSSAGIVMEVGVEAAGQFAPGQRVACAGAGYANHAELVYVPQQLCVPVPEGVSLEAAAFTTVGAIALQGVRQADVQLGERVAVIGLGLVGQLAAQLLRAAGCGVVGIDLSPQRCRLAEELGVDCAIVRGADVERQVHVFAPRGVDAVLITAATSSNDPIELAAALCRDRGRVVVVGAVGMHIPREPFYQKELDLRLSRSYGPGRYDPSYEEHGVDYPIGYVRWTEGRNMEAFLELLARGSVNVAPLITHRFPLERAEEAYALVEGRTGEPSLGVLFTYPEQPAPATRRVALQPAGSTAPAVDTPGISVIGVGNFATGVLLPALQAAGGKQVRWRGVASASGISARTVGRRLGFAFCASEAGELLADPETDAVVIATRHDQHAPLTVRALEAGKTVFVEKPLALSLDELERVVAAQARAQRPLLVGFNRRFSSLTQAVRAHFGGRREPLVLLARVNAGFLPRDHWTQDPVEGGGRILGEACHFVDLLHSLVGSPPVEVDAHLLPESGRYSGDNVCATIRFADGSLGTVLYLANADSALPKERIEVTGDGRAATIDDFHEALLYRGGRVRRIRVAGQDKGHRAEMAALVELLRHGGPPPLPFEEVVLSTLATLAVVESVATGRRVQVDAAPVRDLLTGRGD